MTTASRIAISPLGLAGVVLGLLGLGALLAGPLRLLVPAPLAGLLLVALALRLGVMAAAAGGPSAAPACEPGRPERARRGVSHAVHV